MIHPKKRALQEALVTASCTLLLCEGVLYMEKPENLFFCKLSVSVAFLFLDYPSSLVTNFAILNVLINCFDRLFKHVFIKKLSTTIQHWLIFFSWCEMSFGISARVLPYQQLLEVYASKYNCKYAFLVVCEGAPEDKELGDWDSGCRATEADRGWAARDSQKWKTPRQQRAPSCRSRGLQNPDYCRGRKVSFLRLITPQLTNTNSSYLPWLP